MQVRTEAYKPMRLVTEQEYRTYLQRKENVRIGGSVVKLRGAQSVSLTSPPNGFELERWNVWSFPDRGTWATHSGDYRGNWSPYIPRNLILRYTRVGDEVLDPMVGGGTTLVECRLLGRTAIGVDVNPLAIYVSRDRLNFTSPAGSTSRESLTYEGDARLLNEVSDDSVDLIATHPPYSNIISYTSGAAGRGDLSLQPSLEAYVMDMEVVARECFRVLKPGKMCAIMVGDTRRRKHHIPLAFRVMQAFLGIGFILREDIIKLQWNTKSGREKWAGFTGDFLLLAYEHIFVFRKPSFKGEISD